MTAYQNTTAWTHCRIRYFGIALLTAALTAPLGAASAQAAGDSRPQVGTRVRVATVNPDSAIGSRRAIGVVQSLTDNGMTVAWENGLRSTVSNAEILRMDVSAGPQPYALRGMGVGFLIGAVVGGVIGAATYEPSTFLDFGIGVHIAGGSALGGVSGGVLGGLVGAAGRREGWSRFQLNRGSQRVSVAPILGVHARGMTVKVRF